MYVPKLSINFTKGTSDLKKTSRNLKPQPFLYERLPFQREMKEIEDLQAEETGQEQQG